MCCGCLLDQISRSLPLSIRWGEMQSFLFLESELRGSTSFDKDKKASKRTRSHCSKENKQSGKFFKSTSPCSSLIFQQWYIDMMLIVSKLHIEPIHCRFLLNKSLESSYKKVSCWSEDWQWQFCMKCLWRPLCLCGVKAFAATYPLH